MGNLGACERAQTKSRRAANFVWMKAWFIGMHHFALICVLTHPIIANVRAAQRISRCHAVDATRCYPVLSEFILRLSTKCESVLQRRSELWDL